MHCRRTLGCIRAIWQFGRSFDVDNEVMEAASLEVFEHSVLHIQAEEAAPWAVALYNQDFRRIVARRSKGSRKWNIGVASTKKVDVQ
jgi:hypothetical protein